MALSEESFLPDAEDCAETWRALRWPDGPECVECGSPNVAVQDWDYLSSLRRYECWECGRWFNDRSGTFLESSKVRLPKWIHVLREMDKGRFDQLDCQGPAPHVQDGSWNGHYDAGRHIPAS